MTRALVCALAIAAGIVAAHVRAAVLLTEHADAGEVCDLPALVVGRWAA